MRLYMRVKSIMNTFNFDDYRKKKYKEIINKDQIRVQVNKLPRINKDLALKLMQNQEKKNKKNTNLLKEERFKDLFENPEFEVDKNADEYRLLNPVLSRLDKVKETSKQEKLIGEEFKEIDVS